MAAGLALTGTAHAYTPAAHFYSPSGNIECVFNENDVGKEPQPNTLDCGTFNNHRTAGIDAAQGGGFYWLLSWSSEFKPGRSPVLAYGSTWRRGGVTCKSASTGMSCYTSSTGRGFTISRTAVTRYPPARVASSSPDYVTADAMQATFEENGITVSGRHLSWLDAFCVGQGVPNGTASDRNGVAETRYHLFACYGTLSDNRTAIVHTTIQTWPGQPARFKYTYQVISVV